MNPVATAVTRPGQNTRAAASKLPISVIIATRNEALNLPRCLASLEDVGEVYVVDSQSTDETLEIARAHGAKVVQFHYHGGWPKKRQWAMDRLPLAYEWVLLLDADEALTPQLKEMIRTAIRKRYVDGYHLSLQMHFLGRRLRHGGSSFWKLALFRRHKGHYECRLSDQDASMADMEVHEHVVVRGETEKLSSPLLHYNVDSLTRYIQKHNEYSNWEARMLLEEDDEDAELPPTLIGTQAQRRRWLKKKLYGIPGSPVLLFVYRYLVRLGFLDGIPGLIYCTFQAVQLFHTKAKIYELHTKLSKA